VCPKQSRWSSTLTLAQDHGETSSRSSFPRHCLQDKQERGARSFDCQVPSLLQEPQGASNCVEAARRQRPTGPQIAGCGTFNLNLDIPLCLIPSLQVAKALASLTVDTPLESSCAQDEEKSAEECGSYGNVAADVATNTEKYIEKYNETIMEYLADWEKTVTSRITAGNGKVDEARREFLHYEQKVKDLRASHEKATKAGKTIKADNVKKLDRNVEKYESAKDTHDKLNAALCSMIKEMVEESWRDLYPLLINIFRLDLSKAMDEVMVVGAFKTTAETLKELAEQEGIKGHNRFEELAGLHPELNKTEKSPPKKTSSARSDQAEISSDDVSVVSNESPTSVAAPVTTSV